MTKGKMGCKCQGCGKYFCVDLIVPDEIWMQIQPKEKPPGAGLLCGKCIVQKLEDHAEATLQAEAWELRLPKSKTKTWEDVMIYPEDRFDRKELERIRAKAFAHASIPDSSPIWWRAYLALADAADRLDAIMARHQIEPMPPVPTELFIANPSEEYQPAISVLRQLNGWLVGRGRAPESTTPEALMELVKTKEHLRVLAERAGIRLESDNEVLTIDKSEESGGPSSQDIIGRKD